ncbi:MAG: hypothetical protein ACRBCI_15165 [Cellvibrionaceae bacterium]
MDIAVRKNLAIRRYRQAQQCNLIDEIQHIEPPVIAGVKICAHYNDIPYLAQVDF